MTPSSMTTKDLQSLRAQLMTARYVKARRLREVLEELARREVPRIPTKMPAHNYPQAVIDMEDEQGWKYN